jgi:hypothetical protein
MRLLSTILLACIVVASASSVLAQVAGGTITGVVKDQAGAAVPGTTITVTNVETNRQRIVVSSGEGVYAAAGLPQARIASTLHCQGSGRCGAPVSG